MAKRVNKPRQIGGVQYPVYRGIRQQRGHGIGGLFRGLFRTIAPMLKTGLKKGLTHLGKRALTAGANVLSDISENNTPIKEAFKKQAKTELRALNHINRMKNKKSVSSTKPRKRVTTTLTKGGKRRKRSKNSEFTL